MYPAFDTAPRLRDRRCEKGSRGWLPTSRRSQAPILTRHSFRSAGTPRVTPGFLERTWKGPPMYTKALSVCAALALCAAPAIATAQSAPSDPQTFAEVAASSNMFEIESSQLAL